MSHDRMPSHTQTSLAFLCSILFLIGAGACSGDEHSPPLTPIASTGTPGAEEGVGEPLGFSEEAMRALLLHDYPGNVRELEHLVQRAVVVAQGPLVTLDDLPGLDPEHGRSGAAPRLRELLELPLEEAVQSLERMLLRRALTKTQGNKAEAARLLGIHRTALYTKLKQLGMEEATMS